MPPILPSEFQPLYLVKHIKSCITVEMIISMKYKDSVRNSTLKLLFNTHEMEFISIFTAFFQKVCFPKHYLFTKVTICVSCFERDRIVMNVAYKISGVHVEVQALLCLRCYSALLSYCFHVGINKRFKCVYVCACVV